MSNQKIILLTLLAKSVDKDAYRDHSDNVWFPGSSDDDYAIFDPANNSDQALEVWTWLVNSARGLDQGGVVEAKERGKIKGFVWEDAASWRRSVLEAGLWVIAQRESAKSPVSNTP